MESSSLLDDILAEFKEEFGYSLIDANPDCDYWVFQRTVEGSNTHKLILEDHRWERGENDFNPDKDIGDWLIFSMLTDDERGWFGNYVETQYPLTYSEYRMIEKIIKELENSHDQETDN